MAPSSVWESEPEDEDDACAGLATTMKVSFVCPCCPGKILKPTNFVHLQQHLNNEPDCIPRSFFEDTTMPVKRCPTCGKVWLQRKRGGGPLTCKKCSRASRDGRSYASTPAPTPHQSPAPRSQPATPRGAPGPRHMSRPATPEVPQPESAPATEQPRPVRTAPPLPTLEEVCLLDVRVMSHIPKSLRVGIAKS